MPRDNSPLRRNPANQIGNQIPSKSNIILCLYGKEPAESYLGSQDSAFKKPMCEQQLLTQLPTHMLRNTNYISDDSNKSPLQMHLPLNGVLPTFVYNPNQLSNFQTFNMLHVNTQLSPDPRSAVRAPNGNFEQKSAAAAQIHRPGHSEDINNGSLSPSPYSNINKMHLN